MSFKNVQKVSLKDLTLMSLGIRTTSVVFVGTKSKQNATYAVFNPAVYPSESVRAKSTKVALITSTALSPPLILVQ
jgi:hypothetical protein